MIKFLIYTSKATSEMSSTDIGKILMTARKNNQSMGVTGALLYHDGIFLQILEGFDEIIDELVKTIRGDNRHDDFQILYEGEKLAPDFTEWAMAEVPSDALDSAPTILSVLEEDEIEQGTANRVVFEAKDICQ